MFKKQKNLLLVLGLLLVVISFTYDSFFKSKDVFKDINNLASVQDNSIKEESETKQPKIITLLGKAELSYEGSTDGRSKNIELGVARLDGKVILPNEEFSFIKALGPVSSSQGFSKEKAFKDGEVTLGLGGGLCQVSTILFQSALNAGLPVTDRSNHTFAVPFYQIGLDATFANPAPDLKFINDTGYEITIKGRTENKKAIFEIYGVSDGRQSFLSEAEVSNKTKLPSTKYIRTPELQLGEQKCEHTSQIGYTAKVVYNILYPSGENREQVFNSKYQPLVKTCYIGTGTTETVGCTLTTLYSPQTGARCPN